MDRIAQISLTILTLSTIQADPEVNGTLDWFRWAENENIFDCIVGIGHEDAPVSLGTIVGPNIVVTAANPIQQPEYQVSQLAVYAINGNHTFSKKYRVQCITTPFKTDRNRSAAVHGNDGRHSPLHDLLLLTVTGLDAVLKKNAKKRMPYILPMAFENSTLEAAGMGFAGFGYLDRHHVIENKNLSFEFYENSVLQDCDEWISREWGLFICIAVDGALRGLPAGAPLTQNGLLYGIGSFALRRAKENVFMFTDLRPYRKKMFYCHEGDYKVFNETEFNKD